MGQLTYEGTLEVTTCWCGIVVAVPANLYRQARNHTGRQIYCPLGHTFHYTQTYEERYERERELRAEAERQAAAARDLLKAEERSHSATRGQLTRTRKRASAGVCPCCNRTFQQLARHMKTKHPDFAAQTGADTARRK